MKKKKENYDNNLNNILDILKNKPFLIIPVNIKN